MYVEEFAHFLTKQSAKQTTLCIYVCGRVCPLFNKRNWHATVS